jgi:arylformamidase
MKGAWIDISVPLRTGMVHWPNDAPVQIEKTSDVERGDGATLSTVSMGSHTGTHIDAPRHFIKGGRTIDEMPLSIASGRARVIEINDPASVKPAELAPHGIRRGERILLKTRNSGSVWQTDEFVRDFVYLSDQAADFFAQRAVALIGIDYLSVGSAAGGHYVHRTLLSAGVWLLEGVDLSRVTAGRYELVCLPLRLAGGDGSPARAIVRPA